MQFNPGSSNGIVDEIDFLSGTNVTTYPLAQKTRNVNRWLDRAVYLIFTADGRWQFDDTNQTDLPIATTNLIADQQDYSFNTAHLMVSRIEILDENDNWVLLKPIDQHDVRGVALGEFKSTAGTPQYYDKIANSLFLYPKPSYNKTDGLKVYFQRGASLFTTADTTKEPGIASPFHRYLSLGASFDFTMSRDMKRASGLRQEIAIMENAMIDFYSKRPRDENTRLKTNRISGR